MLPSLPGGEQGPRAGAELVSRADNSIHSKNLLCSRRNVAHRQLCAAIPTGAVIPAGAAIPAGAVLRVWSKPSPSAGGHAAGSGGVSRKASQSCLFPGTFGSAWPIPLRCWACGQVASQTMPWGAGSVSPVVPSCCAGSFGWKLKPGLFLGFTKQGEAGGSCSPC